MRMMRRVTSLAGLLGTLLYTPPVYPQATIDGPWRSDVAAFAHRIVAAGLMPGMSVAVSRRDRTVYSRGFGLAVAVTMDGEQFERRATPQ